MKLKVKSTVGLAMPGEIEVEPIDTVKETIEKVAAMQAYDAKGIALQYNGKLLDENARLKNYGIEDGNTLEVVPKSRKGGIVLPSSFLKNRLSLESQMIMKEGIALKPINPFLWVGMIKGRGKWKGNIYRITIRVPPTYPYSRPEVEWDTPLQPAHPNIFGRSICLSILGNSWRPQFTLVTVYRSLEWLLENPNYYSRLNLSLPSLDSLLHRWRVS